MTPLPACAQYPVQSSNTNQNSTKIRAVAVLEWTGEEGHPKASRLIPVSVFDGQDLQDAGIYLAQPAPLALSNQVEYELKRNGKTIGLFDVHNAGQEQGAWVGFGAWKPLPTPKPAAQVAVKTNSDSWGGDAQSDRPVLHRKHGSEGNSTADSSDSPREAQDPDRPTLHRKASSDSGDSGTASAGPAPDPDRPTLHRETSDTGSEGGGKTPPVDPDRPRLKKTGEKVPTDTAYVESLPQITDPDRPRLLRGKPVSEGPSVQPTLMGMPADMHQAVAVSDARDTPEHLWTYSWANPDDEAKMKADLEDLARKALGLTPPAPAPASAHKRTAASVKKKAKPASPQPAVPLLDEKFRVFELSYGAGATMVLSAHTDGQGAERKFVTLVAQPDLYGNVLVLLKNVTDAAHLDDTPRMVLVDAVDAMADNRGELLFELRGSAQRQFALYRVLRGQVTKLFTSGPEGISPPPKS